jgi:RNA polymerase sigma-70 factor (ECF subfamily)
MTGHPQFEDLVKTYYASLYRFALSLTRLENDACDLTQQTFYIWATKGHQLRDPAMVKTWLFTTLHREFLRQARKNKRFTRRDLQETDEDMPVIQPTLTNHLDGQSVLALLGKLDDIFQAPISLFYLEDCSYNRIAEILEIPLGTVKSRIARGLIQLQGLIRHLDQQNLASPGPRRPSS